MTQTTDPTTPRRSRARLGLFLPSLLLLVLALAWSAGWFWIRGQAAQAMDAWLAREAAAGRAWACADRSITGYPFRLELRCASLRLARADGGFTTGALTAVMQVYQPRHGLIEVAGPFEATQGDLSGQATWTRLRGSFHGAAEGFVRVSLVVEKPEGTFREPSAAPVAFAGEQFAFHARPTPGRFETDGAVDLSLRLAQARIPDLDATIGNDAPADFALDATLERAAGLRTRPLPQELEAWRTAGGRLDVALFSMVKGDRRLQAKGAVGLDASHRAAGTFDVRAAGLEALVGQIMGQRFGAERGALIGNLVGQFLGGLQRRDGGGEAGPAPADGSAALTPLPPLRLAEGRVLLGPIALPNVVLPPLY